MSEESYSLSGRVFHRLREDILSGRYHANEELREKTIGDELGVSRTPVREALRQLELEGLVKIIPNKGAIVEGISVADIKDIYAIRAHLEGLCAGWAATRITEQQLAALEENVFLVEFHEAKGNYAQMLELDNRFHDLLYEASGSRMLSQELVNLHHYVERVRKITLSMPERVIKSNNEHRQIVEALKQHDEDRAEKLANRHIRNAMANMDKYGWENLLK
ncbi:MAG: GntR family transcriptional regulator [Lachnospiraceae bacterium]|nr:GntR family transcriptional regulator [Lachnospiraceae bacterium]